MSDDLPMGWELVGFPEVVFFQEGPGLRKYQYRKSGVPFLNIRTFVDERIDKKLCNYLDLEEVEQKYKHFLVDANDILVATSGSIGKMAIAKSQDLPLMLNTSIMRFRPITEERLERGFLYFFLKSNHFFTQADSAWTGTAQKNMGPSHVKTFNILLPPLNEQRRIVDKLDRIGDRHRTARNELSHIPKLIARYKQAVLAAAFRGDLTADWRKENNINYINHGIWIIPSNWEWGVMSDVCEHITKGTTPSQDKMNATDCEQIPFIKVYNLTFNGTLDFSVEPTFVSLETHENFLKRSKVYPNDVLMNIVGPPLGKVSIVPDSFPEWNINQAIAIFRAKPVIFNKYISNFLIFNKTVNWCIRQAKATAGQFNLTLKICQDIPIPLPPLEEQKEIVRRVEKMFEKIDVMEQEYQKAAKLCDRLEQATLAKAFRGELVAQDPDDEPASVLLEQVKRGKEKGKKGK
jgi:type I restriction enzyme S subunit